MATSSSSSVTLGSSSTLHPSPPPDIVPPPANMLPTRPSITTQLTRPAYTFTGRNYGSWASGFEHFLRSHDLLHHLTTDPPALLDPTYSTWSRLDSAVVTWMLQSIDSSVAEPLARINPAKVLWQTIETMYANKNNLSRTIQVWESLLQCRQGDQSLQSHYGHLQSLFQELLLYQPPTTDLPTLERYQREIQAGIYLNSLRSDIAVQIRGQILTGDRVPDLPSIFSSALRVSTGTPSKDGSASTSTAMAAHTPRGQDSKRGGRPPKGKGRNSFPPCIYCGKMNHLPEKCWKQFGKPEWANNVVSSSTSAPPPSTEGSSTPTLFTSAEIEALKRLASTPTSPSAHFSASSAASGTPALLATPSTWVIDSGASAHMTGNPSILSSFKPLSTMPPVTIADGRSCPVKGLGSTTPTSTLPLTQVLYVPGFPTNLLSISAITRALFCCVTFFPFHCIFQDLRTGRRIGLGRETGQGVYELVSDEPSSGLQALFVASSASSSLLWHRRLGHPCFDKLQKSLPWLSLNKFVCESCQLGKHHRATYPPRDDLPSTTPFDLIHCDVWGPARTPSISGHLYYIVFVDDYTRVSWVYLLHDRTQVLPTLIQFFSEISTQYSTTPKILRTDNALEFVQTALQTFCSDRGILHQTTCPYSSQQNGVAERKHRQLLDITRTLLVEMHVPHYLWSDAILTATYLQNRLPSAPLGNAIPLHRLHPKADLFSLPPRVFGCTAFVHDHTPSLSKLSPRATKGVFVGYSRTQKGYRVYFPETRRYVTSADVTFHEETPFFSPAMSPPRPSASPPPGFPPLMVVADLPASSLPPDSPTELSRSAPLIQESASVPDPPASPTPSPTALTSDDLHLPIALRKGTRTCTQHPISQFVSYDRLHPTFRSFALTVSSESLPKSYVEALRVPTWKEAMDAEVGALLNRGTWELVPRPRDANIVTCKWVFTIKYNPDGTISRHKARLVARGFTQAYGIDYTETFSPVVRLNSIRVLLSLAVNQDWTLHQLDVSNAFLYGDLDEQVFMEQPPGYVAQGESSKVCRLRKAIYGLKQSPRAWFVKFSGLLTSFGFTPCVADPTVLMKQTPRGTIILAVYVDDILMTGSDEAGIKATKEYLKQHLDTRDMGTPRYFLGIEFAYQKGQMALSQRKYALDLLEETGLLGCKPATSPMESRPKFWDTDSPLLDDADRYRRLLGKLIYLTVTRPDIVYTVSVLSQFMQEPRQVHWEGALRVLAYIKHAPGRGLIYRRHGHLRVEAYSDAGYAGDKGDRKSTTGFCTYVGGNLVTWRSRKQKVVSCSSAEAEYRAMAETAREMVWVHSLLTNLGVTTPVPMPMQCDNQAAIFIASNPTFHERTKHIEIDCHYIRDKVLSGMISTPHVSSSSQLADIFTKSLAGVSYDSLCSKLGMFDLYAPA